MTDAVTATAGATPAPHGVSAWHDPNGFGFRDLLDIVNPLQHLPIIGSIYRWLTGDHPGVVAKIAGDALYGGPIGAAVGFVSAIIEDNQGRDLGERALAAVFDSDQKTTAVAAATPAPAALASAAAPASSPASAPAALTLGSATPAAIALGRPDHAPIPLFGGIAQPTPSAAAAAVPTDPAARALLAHNATMQREMSAGSRPAPSSKPVPLVLPAGAITPPRPPAMQSAAAQSTAAQGAAAQGGAAPQPPVDVSQKMMDALDKYMRLQQERDRKPADGSAPSSVDLSL